MIIRLIIKKKIKMKGRYCATWTERRDLFQYTRYENERIALLNHERYTKFNSM